MESIISWEKLQYCSQEKDGVHHKKQFKRFCKILVRAIVDMFPLRDNLLGAIVDKICVLAQCNIRLIRFSFTFIGVALMKVLLG